MDLRRALQFVRRHGIVLESAHGNVVSLADAIAGERVSGNWWSHPKSHQIFWLTRAVRESPEVLVCRLVDGKITYVHRRLWPPLVRLASELDLDRLAAICDVHTTSGKHVLKVRAFPNCVPPAVAQAAKHLSAMAARAELGSWWEERAHKHRAALPNKRLNPTRRSRRTASPRRAG